MSVENTPPVTLPPPPLPLAPVVIEPSVCHICTQTMTESQECLIIFECSHAYHRLCIESHLSKSAECPVCKKACRLCDLRKLTIRSKTASSSLRGIGRGAISKPYKTRSVSRNLFQQSQNANAHVSADQSVTPDRNNPINDHSTISQPAVEQTPERANINNLVDYDEINRMIEQNISRLLHNLNLVPNYNINTSRQRNSADDLCPNFQEHRPQYNSDTSTHSNLPSNTNYSTLHPDKVASIIQNWNLKFDGTPIGLNIEEFLYRVRSLTKDNFNEDFSVICRNLHILLTGKARDWFWRYHKSVKTIDWKDFCEAIRCQYREFKSSFDIREEIRNRKQKPGETFDAFFEAISTITDKLPTPMSEIELVEILARNLRPEVRQDLLYVPVHSLPHLRKLVQMRENFLAEEHVRRNFNLRNSNMTFPRRIAEVVEPESVDGIETCGDTTMSVDALQKPENINRCWNCEETGHHWEDCLKERTIFCYGCGTKQVYKPKCIKCATRKQNFSKNLRTLMNSKENP